MLTLFFFLLKTFKITFLTSFTFFPSNLFSSPFSLSLSTQNIYNNITRSPFSLVFFSLSAQNIYSNITHNIFSLSIRAFILFLNNFPSSTSRMVLASSLANPLHLLSLLMQHLNYMLIRILFSLKKKRKISWIGAHPKNFMDSSKSLCSHEYISSKLREMENQRQFNCSS